MLTDSIKQALPSPEGRRGDLVDWREDAACRGYPLGPKDDPWHVPESKQAKAPALMVCRVVCPVRETCLDASLDVRTREVHGIQGGHTALERRSMIRQRAKRRLAAKQAAAAATLAAVEDEQDEEAA